MNSVNAITVSIRMQLKPGEFCSLTRFAPSILKLKRALRDK